LRENAKTASAVTEQGFLASFASPLANFAVKIFFKPAMDSPRMPGTFLSFQKRKGGLELAASET